MSGQWEIVGKNKKDKQSGKNKKMSKDEKKKFVDNAPKVEDLLPLSQVKTLYAALDTNKEPQKPLEKAVKTKENEIKKIQKKPKEKKEPGKENKPPKTIESAIAMITAADVRNVLEVGQLRFPEAPLVWLKGFASWLNTKLPVDHTDNIFTAKSWEYPLCLLHPEIRSLLKKALREVPDSAVQMFYDYCLTSMANDMTKGSPVTGYKMLLQLVASQTPSVTVADLPKAATLRHSYQNRPAIGCSVMWALGQGGFKDISTGLQVWQQVMYPVYQLRHYTHFVTDYLRHLLARHSISKAVTVTLYLSLLDTVFSYPSPPNHELKSHLRTLQGIVRSSQSDSSLHNVFEQMLVRLSSATVPALRDELSRFLTHCLATDPQTWGEWRCLYAKHMPQSAVLLRHLHTDWTSVSSQLGTKALKETLWAFKATNNDLIKRKQRSEGLQECARLTEFLLAKMSEARKPLMMKTILFVVFMAIAGAVVYDSIHHGFKGSKTGIFLADIGVLKYGEQAFGRVQDMGLDVYRWSRVNVPVYMAQVRAMLGPWLSVLMDAVSRLVLQVVTTTNMVWQYCVDKEPVVRQFVNQYAPGLMESVTVWTKKGWSIATHYGVQVGSLVLKYLYLSVTWLQDNIFVGTWSAENLHRVTIKALNTTQALAAQTMSWINSKIITTGVENV